MEICYKNNGESLSTLKIILRAGIEKSTRRRWFLPRAAILLALLLLLSLSLSFSPCLPPSIYFRQPLSFSFFLIFSRSLPILLVSLLFSLATPSSAKPPRVPFSCHAKFSSLHVLYIGWEQLAASRRSRIYRFFACTLIFRIRDSLHYEIQCSTIVN